MTIEMVGRKVPRGVKGHNMNETSFAHILFATGVPGKPHPVGGGSSHSARFPLTPPSPRWGEGKGVAFPSI